MIGTAAIHAFLFDMDGVIIHSNPLHRIAWDRYNRLHGIETTEEMQTRMYGKRNDEIVRDFFGEDLTDAEVFRHGADKEALYRAMLLPQIHAALVPGVREFLERHRELPAAVATNAETANVELVLRGAGLQKYFRAAVDGSQVRNPKPYPDIYLLAAEKLGVAPENCVVFEDSLTGVSAGLSAGMRVVGLSTTHVDLPGTALLIPHFNHPSLEVWLAEQQPAGPRGLS
jgi:beta-phosphoglucomutase